VISRLNGDFDNDETHGPEADLVVDDHAELIELLAH
jgi:hypothetical protein